MLISHKFRPTFASTHLISCYISKLLLKLKKLFIFLDNTDMYHSMKDMGAKVGVILCILSIPLLSMAPSCLVSPQIINVYEVSLVISFDCEKDFHCFTCKSWLFERIILFLEFCPALHIDILFDICFVCNVNKKAIEIKAPTQEKEKASETTAVDKEKEVSVSLLNIQVGLIRKAWKHPSADRFVQPLSFLMKPFF